MRITDFIHKTTAFTLAEMMVILTVMSVVMAATMPIITAPDSAMLGGTVSDDNLWAKGTNFKSISTANFVAVGMAPDVNTPSTGTAGLFINNKADESSPSQILFTVSPDGKKVYNAGRLYLGYMDTYNVAIGANALMDTKLEMPAAVHNDYKNVAIGDWTMKRGSTSGRVGSVAIGSMASYSNAPDRTVAIGYGALSSAGTSLTYDSVAIGYLAGYLNNGTINRSTDIGYLAGYNTFMNLTSEYNTHIGYQAGALSKGRDNVNIGSLAGFYSNDSFSGNNANPASFSVNIGTNAGAMPSDVAYQSSWQDSYSNNHVAIGNHSLYAPMAAARYVVAIGSYAGYMLRGDTKSSVFIGTEAGYRIDQGSPHDQMVQIGTKAGRLGIGTAVAIGYYAGAMNKDLYYPDVSENAVYAGNGRNTRQSENRLNEVAIGFKTGMYNARMVEGSYGNIMIGNYAASSLNSGATMMNTVCLGKWSCKKVNAAYSLFIGKYAAIQPSAEYPSFSLISFDWPEAGGTSALTSGARVVIDTTSSSRIMGQMIIAPIKATYNSSYRDSNIIFDATNLYGPASKPTSLSDITLKENIKPLKYSLKQLNGINVYEYNYQDEPDTRRIGVIAQELLKVIPEGVDTSKKDAYTINPDWIFYPVINAIKELDKTVESCKYNLLTYAKEYQSLSIKMKSLEKEQKQLERERKSLERQINKAYRKAEKMEKSA